MLNEPQRAILRVTPEEAKFIELNRHYRVNLPRHALDCLRVVNKRKKLVPLVLNKPQLLLHAKIEQQKRDFGMVRALVLKGRKQGASTYIGARFYSAAKLWDFRSAKVMAHDQTSTEVLFNMVKTYYDNDRISRQTQAANTKELKFSNNSTYTVATAGGSGEAGRGDSPDLAHLSEVAFYRNPEKNFAGFVNSIATEHGTEVIAESTGNGVGNEFHRRWQRAEANLAAEGDTVTFQAIFIPWWLSDEYRMPVPSGFQLMSEPEGDGLPSERELAEMFGLDNEQMAWRRFVKDEQLGGSIVTFMQEFPNTPAEAFQSTGDAPFIPQLFVLRARKRRDIPGIGPKILGVDPTGGGGDRYAISFRQGHKIHWYRSKIGLEPDEAVHWVASVVEEVKPDRVNVDYSGGYGTGLISGIRLYYPRIAELFYPVDFGSKSQFKTVQPHRPGPRNRRAEMYMRFRDWLLLPEGVSIPDDDDLQSDLGAVTTKFQSQVTDVLLESKQEIKKRIGRSPDIADSAALTFAFPDMNVPAALTEAAQSHNAVFASGSEPEQARPSSPASRLWAAGNTKRFDSGGGWMI